jgi:hypothetical protein
VGGAISGYCSIGKLEILINPSIRIMMEITVDSTGLSMKVFSITKSSSF